MGKTTNEPASSSQANEPIDNDRKEKRRATNRRSARKSRYREMLMLDELHRNARELRVKNSSLQEENDSLRSMITSTRNPMPDKQRGGMFAEN